MLFNSLEFIFFYIFVTIVFFILPQKFRWVHLLAASCYFYMAFIPVYILILGGTIVVDYAAGLLIEKSAGTKRKSYLIMSLIANIGVLCIFKYYNFFVDNINFTASLFGIQKSLNYLSILLPIGLSFHTFQAMSYTIEVYRGNQKAEKHFGIYALYVMFYPQLVAGPIERPQNILHQFYEKKIPNADDIFSGLAQMTRGFFKKVVVADLLATYVDTIFNNYTHFYGFTVLFAVWLFLFEVYCDFSGYTDIAIGAARTMGFHLMPNFALPLFSKTLSELWKRWHISLSTWFRDYLFNPIVIQKRDWGKWAVVYASLITFLLSGLWHGASWNFVIYGGLQGLFISFEILLNIKSKFFNKNFFRKLLGVFITFNLFSLSLIFFRSYTFNQAISVFKNIFNSNGFFNLQVSDPALFISMMISLFVLIGVEYFFYRKQTLHDLYLSHKKTTIFLSLMFILFIVLFGISNGEQFIYFQF